MNDVICGNSLTELKKIESSSIDLILTSPPYYQQRNYTNGKYREEIGVEGSIEHYMERLYLVFWECVRVCKPTGSIVFNIGDCYIDKSLQLVPYRFAVLVQRRCEVKLINEITWVKTNPTPRQYKKRLVSATEPFFHFVKSDKYFYNREAFLQSDKVQSKPTGKKGMRYSQLIESSDLSKVEKRNAQAVLQEALSELHRGKIADFRMKLRGVHKKAFGGQSGGRNNQIEKQGFTLIRMYGRKLKRDVIESPVADTKKIDHPAVFPLQVINEMIQLLTKVENVVLDPFCGSGQTLIAAKELKRRYMGIDINPKYCKHAKQRLAEREQEL